MTTYAGQPGNETLPGSVAISSSTNATPIEVTTSAAHNLMDGERVYIKGHLTNTGANGTWYVQVTSSTKFKLYQGWTGGVPSLPVAGSAVGSGGTMRSTGWANLVTLPDDGVTKLAAASVNTPFEGQIDRSAYLVERVGPYRLANFGSRTPTFTMSGTAPNGSYSSYDTTFDGALGGAGGYFDVQIGDVVEVEFGPVWVSMGAGPTSANFALALDFVDYGVSTSHAITPGQTVEAKIVGSTSVSTYLRGYITVPGLIPTGMRAYPLFAVYGVGGSGTYGGIVKNGTFAYRVWRQS